MDDVFDDTTIVGADSDDRRRGRRRILMNLKCPLCEGGVADVTYKDVYQLKKFTSVRGKIIGRSKSGMCARHQRQVTSSIKKARYVGLMPYVALTK